jgi:hypothetical protein
MSDLTIFVNTHSSCDDLWPMFFGQLKKYWPNRPPCVVAADDFPEFAGEPCVYDVAGDLVVDYSPAKRFTSQYLMGLCAVETPYVLTLQEDMILYGDVDVKLIAELTAPSQFKTRCFRLIDSGRNLNYSMQASIWDTRELQRLCIDGACELDHQGVEDTPWTAELAMHARAHPPLITDRRGLKRGRDHYDNPHFPYIATALVKGAWNSEYRTELESLHAEYYIDASKRGWSE